MNILRIAFDLFVFYFLYKLIFNFIIPIVKTTSQVKKQFGDMQEKMRGFNQENNNSTSTSANTKTTTTNKLPKEDYIEFEEVK